LEFALLALPLLVAVFSCFDLLFVFTVSANLDGATVQLARQIKTGQLQLAGGSTSGVLQQQLCTEIGWLGPGCPAAMSVDVRTFATFTSVASPNPISNGVLNQKNLQLNLGNPGDIVLVTAYFQWPMLAPSIDHLFQPLNNGSTVVVSSTAFRNEPY
jgi:Flp pilus assembly protein TadG